MEERLYRLERTIEFEMDSYCWEDGKRTLVCHITITTPKLDAEGFVFDNRRIENYFNENFNGQTKKVSCEHIAGEILQFFCDSLPECKGVEVKVSGAPDKTWLSASFERPRAMGVGGGQ